MTWGEIQKSALEKMFAKDEPILLAEVPDDEEVTEEVTEEVSEETPSGIYLSELYDDDDCKWYLSAMPGVANEAIRRLKPYVMNTYELNETTNEYEKTTVPKITKDTEEGYEVELPESACVLISLYIASELYKDDDVALATQYRNEFEAGLQDLDVEIETQDFVREVY